MTEENQSRKLDSLMRWADDMYHAKRFDEVNAVLCRAGIGKLDGSLLYTWLVVSWWPIRAGDHKMPNRQVLINNIKQNNPKFVKQLKFDKPGFMPGFWS